MDVASILVMEEKMSIIVRDNVSRHPLAGKLLNALQHSNSKNHQRLWKGAKQKQLEERAARQVQVTVGKTEGL